MHSEPACRVEFNDLERATIRGHCHPSSHQLQLLALLFLEQVQVHRPEELLQLEGPILAKRQSVQKVEALQVLLVLPVVGTAFGGTTLFAESQQCLK